jgi:hypothetical protein
MPDAQEGIEVEAPPSEDDWEPPDVSDEEPALVPLVPDRPLSSNGTTTMADDDSIPVVTWASSVKSKPINWIWPGRLARGKLTIIVGDPGVGKGVLGVDIAARLSRGTGWPDGSVCGVARTLLVSGEDDPEDTIGPRLEAAGADRTQVGFVGRLLDPDGALRRLDLARDAEYLMKAADGADADLVTIDPLSSYLGGETNSWRDSDVRRVLDPLAEAAARHQVGVLVVGHLNKSSGKAMYRAGGSIAMIAATRFAFLLGEHPSDPNLRVMACVKTNLAVRPPSLTFRLVATRVESIGDDIARVEWVGTSSVTADELVGAEKDTGAAQSRAEAFLVEYLAAGPKPSDDVKAAATAEHVGKNSLWAAKDALGIKARKDGLSRWIWELPDGIADLEASRSAEASRSDHDASGPFNTDRTPSPLYTEDSLSYSEPSRSVIPSRLSPPRAPAHEATP